MKFKATLWKPECYAQPQMNISIDNRTLRIKSFKNYGIFQQKSFGKNWNILKNTKIFKFFKIFVLEKFKISKIYFFLIKSFKNYRIFLPEIPLENIRKFKKKTASWKILKKYQNFEVFQKIFKFSPESPFQNKIGKFRSFSKMFLNFRKKVLFKKIGKSLKKIKISKLYIFLIKSFKNYEIFYQKVLWKKLDNIKKTPKFRSFSIFFFLNFLKKVL